MVTIYVEGKPYQVSEEQNLLEACLGLGFDIPYFCWHPALGSAGACRQCAVKQFKDENDAEGRIVMACMTSAKEGTRISIHDADAKEFRAANIEWLMVNHPHDCPVCDEGGECHLQDMTVMSGHVSREYRFPKRTHHNQNLAPFIEHEMNRCISCYRCVRFYKDYAGGRDFNVFGAHDHVYFGRFNDGAFENEFSGNLVEICPTGVFTDKTLHHQYTRKWDLQTAPSICVLCAAGCNTIPGERYGTVRRIRNRYHYDLNGYFLCDRGRYGYEFINDANRLRHEWQRLDKGSKAETIPQTEAISSLSRLLEKPGKILGIGSPRASLEANYALRSLVGPKQFSSGLSSQQNAPLSKIVDILRDGPAKSASIRDMEQSDAAFILGEDVINVMPRAALALRQSVRQSPLRDIDKLHIPRWQDRGIREAVQDCSGPLFIATPTTTHLDDLATLTYRAAPDDIARLGFTVAHLLDPQAPGVADLTEKEQLMAEAIAADLKESQQPLVVAGVSHGNTAMIEAAANVAFALCTTKRTANVAYLLPESNSMGMTLMGGIDLEAACQKVRNKEVDTVIILENDLYRSIGKEEADMLLAARQVVVLDHQETLTSRQADLVLPTAVFAECSGTLVNYEGRAQRYFQVFEPTGDILPAHRWLTATTDRDEENSATTLDAIAQSMAEEIPLFAKALTAIPQANFRIAGMKIPRQSPRYSGRTSMHADQNVNVEKPHNDIDAPLSFSMEGFDGQAPAPLISRYWAPGWNSVQALNKFQQEVGGPLRGGDPGKRLIEPQSKPRTRYFQDIPSVFFPTEGKFLIVPIHHIFGSEPLSMLTPGIQMLSPKPYMAINPIDMETLGLAAGETALLNGNIPLPVEVSLCLPTGTIGLPVGLVHFQVPGSCTITNPGKQKKSAAVDHEEIEHE